MVMNGVAPSEVRDEMNANAARRQALKAKLAAADASDRAERESGGHAGSRRTNEEVAGVRRPLLASIFGCGGRI